MFDKTTAEYIILAQIASNAGKWYDREKKYLGRYILKCLENKGYSKSDFYRKAKAATFQGYSIKDSYIRKAIERIQKSNYSNITFYVGFDDRYDAEIVYFYFKEEKIQISFHSFYHEKEKGGFSKFSIGDTRWLSNQSSEYNCQILFDMIF